MSGLGEPFGIALITLGLSLIASAVRLIDWFIHSDPKAVAQNARWLVVVLALLAVPALALLLLKEQWTAATIVAALLTLIPALLGRRALHWLRIAELGSAYQSILSACQGHRDEPHDPELIRRSAAILEAYLQRQRGPMINVPACNPYSCGEYDGASAQLSAELDGMSEDEALDILGLKRPAPDADIVKAHRRLLERTHPDRGGSQYLATKVNRAKKVLLRDAAEPARARPGRRSKRPRSTQLGQ